MVERSPEKAGVGGSTPSLATIIPKNLGQTLCTSPVRIQSALTKRFERPLRSWMTQKNLGRCDLSPVRFQSAFVTENRCQHFSCCSHAIPTHRVRVELKCKFDVAVPK